MKEHSIISLVFGVLMDWLKRRAREKPRQQAKQSTKKQKINLTVVGDNNTVIITNGDSKK